MDIQEIMPNWTRVKLNRTEKQTFLETKILASHLRKQ